MKTKRTCCQQSYPNRMAKGSSPNIKEKKIKERILEYQEGRKKTICKNMDKCNRLSFY